MSVARLPEPTPVLKRALERASAPAFQRALFEWVERAAGVAPGGLWLLNDSFDALSRFASHDLPLALDEAIQHRFRQVDGGWAGSLTGQGRVFFLPLHDGRSARGLLEFAMEARGTAWRRTAACLVQVYLAQRQQRQERAALEAMLMQMRGGPATARRLSLKTGHLAPLKAQFERTLIADRMDTHGQAKAAAQSLGITYRSLTQKCKQLGLS